MVENPGKVLVVVLLLMVAAFYAGYLIGGH